MYLRSKKKQHFTTYKGRKKTLRAFFSTATETPEIFLTRSSSAAT